MNKYTLKKIRIYLFKMNLYKKNNLNVFRSILDDMQSKLNGTDELDELYQNKLNAQANSKFVFFFINSQIDEFDKDRLISSMNESVTPNGHFITPEKEYEAWNNITKQYLYNTLYEYVSLLSKDEYEYIMKLIENKDIDYDKHDSKSLENIYSIIYNIDYYVLKNYMDRMHEEYDKLSFTDKIKVVFSWEN